MSMKYCQHCGTQNPKDSKFCSSCGGQFEFQKQQSPASAPSTETYTNEPQPRSAQSTQYVRPPKDRTVAVILALLLGGFGVHKFYLENNSSGLLYLCFFWTGIPEIIGFIEGIIYLTESEEEFQENHANPINF